ncbi:unnamed protein product [Brassica oleracea]
MLRLGNASLASASHSGQIQRGGACNSRRISRRWPRMFSTTTT